MTTTSEADDPPFHSEIWRGPGTGFGDEPKAISYVENHNGQCGYHELACDFEIAASALLEHYTDSGTSNWVAPIAHLVRQTLELRCKALYMDICERDVAVPRKPLGRHDLRNLWQPAKAWLTQNYPLFPSDARIAPLDHLIAAFHAIDPTGDLFRFGMSNRQAYGKQRSYDRVGIEPVLLAQQFGAASMCLSHWAAVVWRELYFAERGEPDTLFDANDFPRIETPAQPDS